MKRILIFSVAYHPFIGGAEIAVKEITDRIAIIDTGIEFEMITLNLDGQQKAQEKIGTITVHRIGGKGKLFKLLFPFMASRYAARLHQEKPYDVVWSIMASFSGFAALFFKNTHREVPFVVTLQEGDPIEYIKHQVRFVYPWFKQIFTKANKIQAISQYLAQFAKDMGATCPIVVVPNGVDVVRFSQPIAENVQQQLREKLGKKPGDVLLITTSRLVTKNAVKDVIAALALLPLHIKFLIVGIGPLEDELKNQVKNLHLESRVLFAGHIEYNDIPNYLAVADIFIRPSLSEGLGNSFIEAMAAGVPIIATRVGGIPDFLTDHETGLFCEVNNPTSIADKVTELLTNPILTEHIKTQAKALVKEKYDWASIAQVMRAEVCYNYHADLDSDGNI